MTAINAEEQRGSFRRAIPNDEYERGFAECQSRVLGVIRVDTSETSNTDVRAALEALRQAVVAFRPHHGMDYGDGEGTVEQDEGNGTNGAAEPERVPYVDAIQPVIADLSEGEHERAIEKLAGVVNDLVAEDADNRIENLSGEVEGIRGEVENFQRRVDSVRDDVDNLREQMWSYVRNLTDKFDRAIERVSDSAKAVGFAAAKSGKGRP